MNPVQLRRQRQRAMRQCVYHEIVELAGTLIEESSLPDRPFGSPTQLEVRIADDFDKLPEDVANAFWADATDKRS